MEKLDNATEGVFQKMFPRESGKQYLSRIGRQVRWSPAMQSISEFSVYQRAFFSMLGKNVSQFHEILCAEPDISFSDLVRALPGPAGVIPETIWSDMLVRAEHLLKKAQLIHAMDKRHPNKKVLFQFLVEQKLSIPGALDFVQHGPAGVFYVGRESTFRLLEAEVFGEKTPSKTEVECRGYVLQTTSMSELNDCIIVLRADARANDVEVGLRHEIKHLYFSSLFPNSDKLSFLDRAKDEIIAYLSEYRDVYGNPEDLSNAVFQAIQGYFDDILEGKIFANLTEEEQFMDTFCTQLRSMIYLGSQLCLEDPNFWVTLMALPARQWNLVLPRVYDLVPY